MTNITKKKNYKIYFNTNETLSKQESSNASNSKETTTKMSNLLFMDESNGNGIYASKPNHVKAPTTSATVTTTVNINHIMAATMSGGSSNTTLHTSMSNEDLSQSLSEYTDADESISAPTEFLAEFLSAVMLKDYKKALKYCKLILQYEPNNLTAKDFYPLILEKLRGNTSSDSDENYNKSSSPDLVLELQSSDPSAGESDEVISSEEPQLLSGDIGVADEENFLGEPHSQDSSMSASPDDVSLSDSVNDVDDENDIDEENAAAGIEDTDDENSDGEEENEDEEDEDEDAISSSGDDLPMDDPHLLVNGVADAVDGNGSRSSSGGEGGRSRSDNTSHSYSSLLLEEEEADDIGPAVHLKNATAIDLDVSNGNKIPSASCSDSESPTEPLTQRLAAILRSKSGASNGNVVNY